jgi:transcriptional regulator with XRE-family HTH domain
MGNDVCAGRRPVPADRQPVPADQQLRDLLRTCRRAAGSLSQRAAAQRAGISPVYWQKIESRTVKTAPAGTLAAMFLAVSASPGHLRDAGYAVIADIMDELARSAAREVTAEDHLAATPGATEEEITALQAIWRALKASRTADPLEQDFTRHARRGDLPSPDILSVRDRTGK